MIFFDIDTQNDFMDPEGSLYIKDSERIKRGLKGILEFAGRHGITVVSTKDWHSPDDPEFEEFPPHCIHFEWGSERFLPHLPTITRGKVVFPNSSLKPEVWMNSNAHFTVYKKTFSPFSNPWLRKVRDAGYFKQENCVIFGVATDYCVKATVEDLTGYCKKISVLTDVIAGVDRDASRECLKDFLDKGIHLTDWRSLNA